MMLVDTSFWKALVDQKDTHHQAAARYFNMLSQDSAGPATRLIITDYIFSETVTLLRLSSGLGLATAEKWANGIHSSKLVETIFIGERIFKQSWQIFTGYRDKSFSFVDCTSFALCRSLKLKTALSFDKHFKQFGLNVFPR